MLGRKDDHFPHIQIIPNWKDKWRVNERDVVKCACLQDYPSSSRFFFFIITYKSYNGKIIKFSFSFFSFFNPTKQWMERKLLFPSTIPSFIPNKAYYGKKKKKKLFSSLHFSPSNFLSFHFSTHSTKQSLSD